MKQVLTFIFLTVSFMTNAQSDKYSAAMQKNLVMLDSAFSKKNFSEVSNNFERIATAEKTQWLPYYYASYTTIMEAMTGEDKSKNDEAADRAEGLITKAEAAAGKENSETAVLKSMIATTHLMVDPMSRYMKYGAASAENLEKAKLLDPTNPRPYFLEGQAKLYTPPAFGGGKDAARPILEQAVKLYSTFKPESPLHPTWGKQQAESALEKCK